jgi:hypothetical protein
MRKFFFYFGVVAAAVLVLAVVLTGYAIYQGGRLEADAKPYVDDAVVTITAHWKSDELRARATPELLKSAGDEQLHTLFDAFSTLGPLVDYHGAQSNGWRSTTTIAGGTIVTADFSAHARYAKGDATIQLSLVKVDGRWMINGFHVDSPALLSRAIGTRT